jgi:hypothetical protein
LHHNRFGVERGSRFALARPGWRGRIAKTQARSSERGKITDSHGNAAKEAESEPASEKDAGESKIRRGRNRNTEAEEFDLQKEIAVEFHRI